MPAEAAEAAGPEWAYGALETVEAAQFYNAVSRTGIQYGPHFRIVRRTNIAPDTAAQLRCGLRGTLAGRIPNFPMRACKTSAAQVLHSLHIGTRPALSLL